jgi:selenium metabolism protein YedF
MGKFSVKEGTQVERLLDCRGLSCPQPVLKTKEALEALDKGTLKVLVDNEGSCTNVLRFAQSQGHLAQSSKNPSGYYEVIIEKGEGEVVPEVPPQIVCDAVPPRSMVVVVSSESLGRGDEELGRRLMAAYLDTLGQFAREITHIVFINSGVKLATEGSPVLEQVQALERMGAKVLSCGTCLNHFGLTEKLKVGTVSNMLSILEILAGASKVLSI